METCQKYIEEQFGQFRLSLGQQVQAEVEDNPEQTFPALDQYG